MLKAFRKRLESLKGDERGFTLVELLVVITIVGILAGVGISGYRSFQDRAYEAAADAAWRDLQIAINLYEADGNTFPRAAASVNDDPNAEKIISDQLIPPPDPLRNNLWDAGDGMPKTNDVGHLLIKADGFVVGGTSTDGFTCVWVNGIPAKLNKTYSECTNE